MRRYTTWVSQAQPWALADQGGAPSGGIRVARPLPRFTQTSGLTTEVWSALPTTSSVSYTLYQPPPYNTAVLNLNPVAYWPLDGNGQDATGNGYNLTVTGSPTWETSGPGGSVTWSVYLNGSTYLTAPSSLNPGGWSGLSVVALVMFASAPSDNPRVICNSHTDDESPPVGFQLMFNGGLGSGFFDIGNNSSNIEASWSKSTALATNTWYLYGGAWTASTGGILVSLNGVTVGTSSGGAGTTVAASTYPVTIGRNPVYNGDYVTGYLAGIALWDRGLSAQDFQTLFDAWRYGS